MKAFPVARLLRPRSVAIVGVSPEPSSMGGRALTSLEAFGFEGDIHLVSRSNAKICERPCVPTIDDLPMGVDAMILALPASAVLEAAKAAARRDVGGMVVFAAGFSEVGDEGRALQDQISAVCNEAGMALLGPNTLGMTNYVGGAHLGFGPNTPDPVDGRPGLAVIAQSGAMAASMRLSSRTRGLRATYSIATGNEAVTGVEDYLAEIVEDASTNAIAIYAEQLRKPRLFLDLAARARANGKPIIMLHPGHSEAARVSATSHTGALSGDYATMRALVEEQAVVVVETMEEWFDAAEMLARFPDPSINGPGVITDSGAFRGLALDLAETVGLSIPELSAETAQQLGERLPAFASQTNPLDITAQGLKDMGMYGEAAAIMQGDAGFGGLILSLMPGSPEIGKVKAQAVISALGAPKGPTAFVLMGGAAPVAPDLERFVLDAGMAFFRSPERALRIFGHVQRYAKAKAAAVGAPKPARSSANRISGTGTLPEHVGKAIIVEAGLCVPEGGLATSVDDALAIAERIGWPVVAKAQSAELPHKTEAGGVVVGIGDAEALRTAWADIHGNVATARPDLTLDGVLIEAMSPRGVEMVIGGRNDRAWGPVLLFGLGGIWIEALADVRLTSASVSEARVIEELGRLRGAALMQGFRGAAPVDAEGLAKTICAVGRLLIDHPEIAEIDLNPVMAFAEGSAPIALDALIVLRD